MAASLPARHRDRSENANWRPICRWEPADRAPEGVRSAAVRPGAEAAFGDQGEGHGVLLVRSDPSRVLAHQAGVVAAGHAVPGAPAELVGAAVGAAGTHRRVVVVRLALADAGQLARRRGAG